MNPWCYSKNRDVPNKVIYERLAKMSEAVEQNGEAEIVLAIAAVRLKKFDDFYDSVSCLFAEGVEFMDKVELYNAFKKEFLNLAI